MPVTSRLKKDHLHLLWLGLALVIARYLTHQVLHIYDDAFITFRYGRNLAEGNGFVYNLGEPVLGTTAPAFGLLTALLHLLGLPVPSTVVGLNILFDLAILAVTFYAVAPKEGRIPCYLFGTFFAISPIMSRICVGGMEVDAFLLLSISAILLYHKGWARTAIAIASVAYFFRPEGVMLAGLLVLIEFFSGKKKQAFVMAGIALAVVTPPLLMIYSYYGQIFSQSVVAKTYLPKPPFLEFIQSFLFPDLSIALFLPFAIWGFVLAFRREGFVRTVAMWGALYILAYTIARPFMWTWYGESVYYVFLLLGSIGMYDLVMRFLPTVGRRWLPYTAIAGGVLAIAFWGTLLLQRGPSEVTKLVHRPLEQWSRQNLDTSSTVIAYDIGALGYYSGARMYDMAGLVTPDRFKYPTELDMIRHYAADYVFVVMTKEPGPMHDPSMASMYRPVARFSQDGHTSLTLSNDNFPPGWTHDYFLFKRLTGEEMPDLR